MGCCLIALALMAMPRAIVFLMFLSGYLSHAYQNGLTPLLGFFFLPWTTAAYAIAMNNFGGVNGIGLVLVIVGVFLDLGSHGGAEHVRRSRASRDDS